MTAMRFLFIGYKNGYSRIFNPIISRRDLEARIIKHAQPKISLGTVGINEGFQKNQGKLRSSVNGCQKALQVRSLIVSFGWHW